MLLFRFYNVYVLRPHVHLCYWFSTRLSIFMPFGSIRFVFLFIWLAVTVCLFSLLSLRVSLCLCLGPTWYVVVKFLSVNFIMFVHLSFWMLRPA